MSIYRLNIDSGAIHQSGQVPNPPYPVGRDQQAPDGTDGTVAPDQVLVSGSLGKTYKEFLLKTEHQNGIAGSIRNSDRAAELLGQKIDALKEPLETIVKNFPPFSKEDKERMRLLRGYSSIRKEIDELTVPPPPEVIKARKAAEALPPTLPMTADDSQIADHVSKLDATAASLSDFRKGLAAETASLLHNGGFTALSPAPKAGKSAEVKTILTESAASQVSAEVGRQFAISTGQGVTADDHSQFLKGLS